MFRQACIFFGLNPFFGVPTVFQPSSVHKFSHFVKYKWELERQANRIG